MKRYTLTIADGKGGSREIKVRLDDETSRLLKEAGDPELTRAYIIEEYKARNAERKETRRHVSLDKCMEHGWDIADGRADTESIAERRERDALLYAAMTKLLPQQRELIKQVYYERIRSKQSGGQHPSQKNLHKIKKSSGKGAYQMKKPWLKSEGPGNALQK